jgi:ABC-2 type transport system ATP-binding protein
MDVITIDHLTRFYGKSRGITDVSLSVPRGDIFGFIGPNGAGKSTTIRVLLNLIFPTSGMATIFGLDVVRQSTVIRRRIGYVPSDAGMYDRMTVAGFLGFCSGFYGSAPDPARYRHLLDAFDLDPGRKINDLSTGNKKKVSIIQALLHKPELLILDEPTAGLDPLIQSRFFEILSEENRQGVTILFSSHTLSEVQAFCRSVAIIREGTIVHCGPIGLLRDKQLKRVSVTFDESRQLADLGLATTGPVECGSGKTLTFMYPGELNDLVAKLAGETVRNLTIEEPSLEEIFLHYYRK